MSNAPENGARAPQQELDLVFVHLSDIHFQFWSGDRFDTNGNLRNELLIDAEQFANQMAKPHGVLLSGDIAFSGVQEQYSHAKDFLTTLCEKFGRTIEIVWCVPGNHDIDRGRVNESPLLLDQHDKLRQTAASTIEAQLAAYLRDPEARDLLFRPLTEYNRFAASFRCAIGGGQPFWDEPFTLNDGSRLIVRGLNSTIASHDDNEENKMVLGEYQVPLREPGTAHLVVCHHPPSSWRDQDRVERALDAKAQIQLFGHKHTQRITRINNALRLSAGAMHPSREELDWDPRYNWLSMRVSEANGRRTLHVKVYPRIWNENDQRFGPDHNSCEGREYVQHDLPLDPWEPPQPPQVPRDVQCDAPSPIPAIADAAPVSLPDDSPRKTIMNPERTLTYRFFDLPHIVRLEIARTLDLYHDEDEGLQDFELFARIFKRAIDADVLADLWGCIEEQHGDGRYSTNPFRRSL